MQTCYNIVHLSVTGLSRSIITKTIPEASRSKGLIDMYRTRWAAHHTAYTHFYQAHPHVIAALKNFSCGANHDMCGDEYQDATWDRKSKDDAVTLLASLATFVFIVSFLVLYEFLSHLSGAIVKLQGQSIDIIKAYQEVEILNGTLFFFKIMSQKEIKALLMTN